MLFLRNRSLKTWFVIPILVLINYSPEDNRMFRFMKAFLSKFGNMLSDEAEQAARDFQGNQWDFPEFVTRSQFTYWRMQIESIAETFSISGQVELIYTQKTYETREMRLVVIKGNSQLQLLEGITDTLERKLRIINIASRIGEEEIPPIVPLNA